MSFPIYIRVGAVRIHPHLFFELLSFAAAFAVFLYLRQRRRDPLTDDLRWWVITAGMVGGAIGCRFLAWLDTWPAPLPGKTVVGGIAGGILAVELLKGRLRVKTATGDLFAIPIAVGIMIGRVGCFLTGLADDTYGTVTTLPIGVDLGDGIKRHPVQLYEIMFLMVLILVLRKFWQIQFQPGDVFKLFLISYMSWRFFIDFLKPASRMVGLSVIQMTCLAILVYYAPDLVRILKSLAQREGITEEHNA